ncbi:MAG: hypothetical protein EBS38_02710 [Actinobacteria bacterium]|nr:hypothetical protein [Actinomycetota bacterium]
MREFPTVALQRYRTYTASNPGFSNRTVTTSQKAVVELSDYRFLLNEISKLNKEIHKEMKKDYRRIAQDVQKGIRDEIKTKPPLSGMRKAKVPGRVTWGNGKPARSAIIRLPRNARGNYLPIAQIRVGSPATIIADMAGKSNAQTNSKARTAMYDYTIYKNGTAVRVQRDHAITKIGSRKFIANLDSRLNSRASRMIYPGAEKKLPEAREEIQLTVAAAVDRVNRELRRAY